jgi:hypothetical protein
MPKAVKMWFRCEYPGCSVETDSGYEVMMGDVKAVVCGSCLKKLVRKNRTNESSPPLVTAVMK